MPYESVSDLPEQTEELSSKQKRAFLKAFNSAVDDGKSEKSAFRIAWSAAKGVSKHMQGEHDQDTHDPTRRERAFAEAERGAKWLGTKTRELGERARGTDIGAETEGVFNEATTKELVGIGAYSGMAVAATRIGANYVRSPTVAMAYGGYALAMAVLAGLTVADVCDRVRKSVDIEDPTIKFVDSVSEELGVEPEQLLSDLGEWLANNDISPDAITPASIKTFFDDYDVSKRLSSSPVLAAGVVGELAT